MITAKPFLGEHIEKAIYPRLSDSMLNRLYGRACLGAIDGDERLNEEEA
jgi:hypothetical protein